ncbi:MAG: mannonate dehydratase [Lachnospiraceae bacterium]|nr:mannonate dehydratase [Lachnospiraceae bacterium]
METGFAFFHKPSHMIVQRHARELGIKHAVSSAEWSGGFGPYIHPWDYMPLLKTKLDMKEYGMDFDVLEGVNFLDDAKLGTDRRDEAIDHFIKLLENMSKLNIGVCCYNWMPVWGWFRTQQNMELSGGATVTGFDASLIPTEPVTELGLVKKETLWKNLKYFLEAVVPYAEKYRIRLAIHPDDPPVDNIGGIERILTSAEAMQRVIDLVDSEYNGITFCQGSFAAMGEDVPVQIRNFGSQGKLFFAHFRDINGTGNRFNEEFHDTGMTDMAEAMKAYYDIGFQGVIRPDHVPTMTNDVSQEQGYGVNGNLYAAGYMAGLMEALKNSAGR